MKHETMDQRVAGYGFDADKLMARRATIISLLRSLQKSLEQNDQVSDGPKSLAEKKNWAQEAGIKAVVGKTRGPKSKLSHRGVQLAKEVRFFQVGLLLFASFFNTTLRADTRQVLPRGE